jgi:hypothetical protein
MPPHVFDTVAATTSRTSDAQVPAAPSGLVSVRRRLGSSCRALSRRLQYSRPSRPSRSRRWPRPQPRQLGRVTKGFRRSGLLSPQRRRPTARSRTGDRPDIR